ncbi:cell adhesion molecule CEACAM8-like isoform X2 [Phyllobates terribilis]|uniref:cell adhesion molecule CEACAM8-like isoform X2 n=1 Tax=Phyllobates terribilis TaxID=111132 RepID=UPI003CCB5EC1
MINLQETHNNPPSAMRGFIKTVLLIITMDVTSGQISIQPIPQSPVINGSVTLSLSGINEMLDSVTWYKGQDSFPWLFIVKYSPGSSTIFPGKQHNDRISVFINGSLHIKDLQITDEGRYKAEIYRGKPSENVNVILTIYEPVTKPKIIGSITQTKENDPLTLTCNTSHAIRWTRNRINIPPGAKLSGDNKTLTFSRVNRGDAGEYRCEAENIASTSASDPYTVTVAYGPDKAEIKISVLVKPGSSITLTCSADSYPPPEYQWKVNGTGSKEKSNKYVINNDITEDEGQYTCVVRNPVTLRNATDSVYVNVTAGSTKNGEEKIHDYQNDMAAEPREDPSYMGLESNTEDIYTELQH